MILTEADARLKWCRHRMAPVMQQVEDAFPNVIPGTVGNSVNGQLPKCIASDCMAWRLASVSKNGVRGFCGAEPVPPLAVTEAVLPSSLTDDLILKS